MQKPNVVSFKADEPLKLRIFEASSGHEQTGEWEPDCLEKFAVKIRKNRPNDGDIIHCAAFHKVHRCILNLDRNEIHLYWFHIIGYDPVKEFNELKK